MNNVAPNRFHVELYNLVHHYAPKVCVETGFNLGKSAIQFLAALDNLERGVLYSIELITPQAFVHPRLKFVKGYSHEHMPKIFMETGAWHFFLHDSDHEVGCTTFEYELAYRLLNPGGILMSDDLGWGVPPHLAWQKCLVRHGFNADEYVKDGGAGHIIKPMTEPAPIHDQKWLDQQVLECKQLSNEACKAMGVEPYFPNL